MKSLNLISWLRPSATTTSAVGVVNPPVRSEQAVETRYCLRLRRDSDEFDNPSDLPSLAKSWESLERDMALVPSGETIMQVMTPMLTSAGLEFAAEPGPAESVDPLYIDRHAVTNAEFAAFVAAGNYKEVDLWPQQVLPYVLQFVDSTGHPGPQAWKNGEPEPKRINHPVVGISWFESDAYARWVGKQLPSAPQWQRAGTWSTDMTGSPQLHSYPWGASFDSQRANTWPAGRKGTVAVTEYSEGSTPNGVQQLIGNVWEWTATAFECLGDKDDMRFIASQPLVEIRGGAFDTYFASQATCQFRSAKSLFFRGANVGFRCCVEVDSLCPPLDPFELIERTVTD